jgi:hypothetical protein
MTLRGAVLWTAIAVAAGVAVRIAIAVVWRGVGAYRLRKAGPRRLQARHHVLWRDPGPIATRDLRYGPGGAAYLPVAPFRFVEEHDTGSQPCVSVVDARGRRWRVKWGHEARVEAFAVRFAAACGYFAEVTHFVSSGAIDGVPALQRAAGCVELPGGRFVDARFELDDPAVRKLFEEHSWSWDDNPFIGSRELDGLKIVVMLLSNWDTKDRRDVARGSNTAIFEHRTGRWPRARQEARYLLTDWGGAMGKWGTNIVTRGRWDVDGFEAQTPQFVTGVGGGRVQFGYTGQRTDDIAGNIPVTSARWFHSIAHGFTERQLADGFLASGATGEEAQRFARALMSRLAQLEIKYSP